MRKLSPGKLPGWVTGCGWPDPSSKARTGHCVGKATTSPPPWEAGRGSEGREAVEPTNSQAGDTVGHAAQRGLLTLGATASWSVKGVTERQRRGAGQEGDGSPAHSEETRRAFCSYSHLWLWGQNIRGKPQKPYNLTRTLHPNCQPASTPRSLTKTQPTWATHAAFPPALPSWALRTGQMPRTGHRAARGAGGEREGHPRHRGGSRARTRRQAGSQLRPSARFLAQIFRDRPGMSRNLTPLCDPWGNTRDGAKKGERFRTSFLDPSAPSELAG